MTLVVVNQGEESFLDLVLAVGYTLRLFRTDVTAGLTPAQIDALTQASFTEATFTGYTAAVLTGGSWTTTPGDPAAGVYAQQSFVSSANQTAQTIYGYYVTRTSDGALQWFERFATPVIVEFVGDTVRVTPRMTLENAEDAVSSPEIVVFTATGSFVKANYPWARRARVRLVGGGGAGGGVAATGVGQVAEGAGAGGGGYAERWLDVSSLAASETVTVGAGGAGVSGGTGGSGGTSSFGTWVAAAGGLGGEAGTATTGDTNVIPGSGGAGTTGDVLIAGMSGHEGTVRGGAALFHNEGGHSMLGPGSRVSHSFSTSGTAGSNYGGGASGARNAASQAARAGAAGAAGIVVVELY